MQDACTRLPVLVFSFSPPLSLLLDKNEVGCQSKNTARKHCFPLLHHYWSQLEASKVLSQPAFKLLIQQVLKAEIFFLLQIVCLFEFLIKKKNTQRKKQHTHKKHQTTKPPTNIPTKKPKPVCYALNFSSAFFFCFLLMSLLWINLRWHAKEAFSLSLHLSFVNTFLPWERVSLRIEPGINLCVTLSEFPTALQRQ